ncbi:MAG: urease accessory protein UreE [Oscillatoriales cyanobacterium]|nr:MAG: urease accessory protein UreE [Oscillatoriales cyanobacterium]
MPPNAPPPGPSPRHLAAIAEDRVKVRRQVTLDDGTIAWLQLARGTVLRPGDRLRTAEGDCCWVVAQPEPVLTVRSTDPLALLQAAYHLGNRHAPLEIAIDYLRLAPDPTLKDLLERRGLTVTEEIAPFMPDSGAYAPSDRPHHASHRHVHHHHP